MSVKKLTRLYEQLSVEPVSPPISPTSSSVGMSFHENNLPNNLATQDEESAVQISSVHSEKRNNLEIEYNKMISNNDIKSLGMTSMEIEAEKRGQRWRNLSYLFFRNQHAITDSELHQR